MLNQPYDGLPPGFTQAPRVGPVVQLHVRTHRWSFTATFLGVFTSYEPLRLIDEALIDVQVTKLASYSVLPASSFLR